MQCAQCNESLTGEEKFCPCCGNAVLVFCPACGAILQTIYKFCPECGSQKDAHEVTSTKTSTEEKRSCLDNLLVCPVTGMEFVEVPGGTFEMGDLWGGGGSDEQPVHSVTVSSFRLGKYPVNQAQWKKVMGSNPSHFRGDNRPVESVSWDDCQRFTQKLNQQSGRNYRLSTEAEWEYACRSGGQREKWAGCNSQAELGHYAWYDDNSNQQTHPVGQKRPNGLGLYDMSGNVCEWCQDWFDHDYYKQSSSHNPPGLGQGSSRVFRGGGWYNDARIARSANRNHDSPDNRYDNLGLRLALPTG